MKMSLCCFKLKLRIAPLPVDRGSAGDQLGQGAHLEAGEASRTTEYRPALVVDHRGRREACNGWTRQDTGSSNDSRYLGDIF